MYRMSCPENETVKCCRPRNMLFSSLLFSSYPLLFYLISLRCPVQIVKIVKQIMLEGDRDCDGMLNIDEFTAVMHESDLHGKLTITF